MQSLVRFPQIANTAKQLSMEMQKVRNLDVLFAFLDVRVDSLSVCYVVCGEVSMVGFWLCVCAGGCYGRNGIRYV